MISRGHLFFGALILGLCLVAGLFSGFKLTSDTPVNGQTAAATLTASTPAPLPTLTPKDQVVILLLVVDDRLAPKPTLLGCWVITYQPGVNRYFLLGFPVRPPLYSHYSVTDYFNADQSLEARSRFVDEAIKNISSGGLRIQYHIVVDQAALISLVNLVGGLELDPGQPPLDGAGVVSRYAQYAPEDQAGQMRFQQDALKAFGQALQQQAWTADALQTLYTTYRLLSPDADDLLALAQQADLQHADFEVELLPSAPQ